MPLLRPPPAEGLRAGAAGGLRDRHVRLRPRPARGRRRGHPNVVLTGARVWSTLVTGESRPKDAAADWALARLPEAHRLVLERAWAIYVGDEEEHWGDLRARVRPHVEHVVAEIEKTHGR